MPAVGEHLTAKNYIDQTIFINGDESFLSGLDPSEQLELDEQDSTNLNSCLTSSKTIKEILTKAYIVSVSENNRNRRVISTVFDNQDNEFDYDKLANITSIFVEGEPDSDNEPANKKILIMN